MSAAMTTAKISFGIVAASILGATSTAWGADYYEGKTVTIVVGSPAGSSYDLYSRLLAQGLTKYIPGKPTVIVRDMPGGAGIVSAGYMFDAAPRDGTYIGSAVSTVTTGPILHPEMAKIDITKFGWLGNVSKDIYFAYVWNTVPISTFDEAKTTQVVMGGVAVGASSVDLAIASNYLFGTKFKIVTGYGDQNAIRMALERGEVHGSFGAVYGTVKATQPDLLTDGKVKIIMQHGFQKHRDLPNVPLFLDQAKTDRDRQMLRFMLAPTETAKPFYVPPGVPAERVEILRRAFDRTIRDPDFLRAAEKAKLEVVEPSTGEELAALVQQIATTPPEVVEQVRQLLASFK